MATVRIPATLRSFTGNRAEVVVPGATARAVLEALVARHPELGPKLFDDARGLRRYVNVFLGDEDLRYLGGLDAPVGEQDTLTLIPAMAGG